MVTTRLAGRRGHKFGSTNVNMHGWNQATAQRRFCAARLSHRWARVLPHEQTSSAQRQRPCVCPGDRRRKHAAQARSSEGVGRDLVAIRSSNPASTLRSPVASIDAVRRCFSASSNDGSYSTNQPPPPPLEGVRVLDLTRVLAGPTATQALGDLGADVLKIEHPSRGDDTRSWGPPFSADGEAAYFISVNRNKRSVTVNIADPEGARIVQELAKHCDVVVENFVVGKLSQYGLDYQTLSAINPRLVYCSITGYGQTGPYAHRAGYDVIAAAAGGLLHITGDRDGPPAKVGVAVTDIMTGLYAYGAIAAALLSCERTGVGQHIDCCLLDTQVAMLANIGANWHVAQQKSGRWGTAHPSIVPYQGWEAADGPIIVGAGNDSQFKKLVEAMGLPELALSELFSTNRARVENRAELVASLSSVFKTKSVAEWMDVLGGDGANLPCSPINDVEQVFGDPAVVASGIVEQVEHSSGLLPVTGHPVRYNGFRPPAGRIPPPNLGAHTDEVLLEFLGADETKLAEWRARGVI